MNIFAYSPFCQHAFIDDVVSGSRVCYICGHVCLESVMFGEEFATLGNRAAKSSSESAAVPAPAAAVPAADVGRPIAPPGKIFSQSPICYDMMVREFLHDSLAPVHMDSSFLIDKTVGVLYQIALEDKANEAYLHLSLNQAKDRGRLAYVLWDVLKMEKCPRPPLDLAVLLNTSTLFMRSAEKELDRQPSHSHLADYVHRLAGELHLPGWCAGVVEHACWHTTGSNAMVLPEHMVGAIMLELGHLLTTHVVGMGHALTVDHISSTLGCSKQRLERLRDRLTLGVKATLIARLCMLAQKRKIHVHDLACLLAVHQASKMSKRV